MEDENSGLLNLRWRHIRHLVILSWLAFFPLSWVGTVMSWGNYGNWRGLLGYLVIGVGVAVAFAVTLIPGATALLRAATRPHLLSIPTAAALSAFTLSLVIGVVTALLVTAMAEVFGATAADDEQFAAFSRLAVFLYIGIVSFPLTFGFSFPLAIPLLCSLIVWVSIRRGGQVSRLLYVSMIALSTLGWWGVIFAGMFLGLGG